MVGNEDIARFPKGGKVCTEFWEASSMSQVMQNRIFPAEETADANV